MIRTMTIEDYEQVYALWKKIHGFGLRSIDDSSITSVWMKRTADVESGKQWSYSPWRL